MKLLPYQLWIIALTHPHPTYHNAPLPSKEVALNHLRELTGQDFGNDAEKWREWFRKHPPK